MNPGLAADRGVHTRCVGKPISVICRAHLLNVGVQTSLPSAGWSGVISSNGATSVAPFVFCGPQCPRQSSKALVGPLHADANAATLAARSSLLSGPHFSLAAKQMLI